MRKKQYGPITEVPHHPPMESPAELVEAAKPGRQLNEKEIAARHNKYESRFQWGFKGTHKLPTNPSPPLKVHTPDNWRRVGIEETGETFRLVELVSHVAISPTTLRLLQLSEVRVENLTLDQAIDTGGVIEDAMQRLLPGRAR